MDSKTDSVKVSDDKRQVILGGSYISYNFSSVSIPRGATVSSVVVYVEHFEDEKFIPGKMQWHIGTGWPNNPMVWVSADAPVRKGQKSEAVDSWDITSFVNTPDKVGTLQLQIKNNDTVSRKTGSVDYVYAVVEWEWPAPQKIFERKPESESDLVEYKIATDKY